MLAHLKHVHFKILQITAEAIDWNMPDRLRDVCACDLALQVAKESHGLVLYREDSHVRREGPADWNLALKILQASAEASPSVPRKTDCKFPLLNLLGFGVSMVLRSRKIIDLAGGDGPHSMVLD